MIRWKWMPGFLYQTEDAGKSKTVERQKERERVSETERCWKRVITSAIK